MYVGVNILFIVYTPDGRFIHRPLMVETGFQAKKAYQWVHKLWEKSHSNNNNDSSETKS